jgi:hypothetical protein
LVFLYTLTGLGRGRFHDFFKNFDGSENAEGAEDAKVAKDNEE